MQYPASASYRNNQRVSLNAIIDKAQGPSEPASAIVKGKVEDLWDRRVSHHKATTGRDPVYVIVDVSDDAMHSVQLAPMVKRKLGEGFSRDSGNVMQHIATSNGKSNWLFSRAFQAWNPGDKGWLFQALREGARQCASIADATQTILIEHYASQANPRCARVELVWSRSMDHAFVRVVMKDGTLVIHDHWINPEVFLAEDGRFSSADDLTVKSSWSPGDPLPQRWEDLKQQAKDAGPIKDKELDAAWRSFVGKGTPNDLVAYARLKIIRRQTLDRTESDCLLTESQAAERGLQPNEKIVYHHGGTYYANDVVAESSLRRAGDPAFPRLHLQQAQWELDVEAACVRRDLPALIPLLQRTDVRQWFPERHRNLCLGAMNIALGLPLDRQNMALIGALFDNAIDAATATQMQQMLRMRAIGDALNMGDAVDLVNLLSPECVCATGDGGAPVVDVRLRVTQRRRYQVPAGSRRAIHATWLVDWPEPCNWSGRCRTRETAAEAGRFRPATGSVRTFSLAIRATGIAKCPSDRRRCQWSAARCRVSVRPCGRRGSGIATCRSGAARVVASRPR